MTAGGYSFKYLRADSGFNVPNRDTSTGRGTVRGGSIVFDSTSRIFYGWNGIKWSPFGSGSGTGSGSIDSITIVNNNFCIYIGGVPSCITLYNDTVYVADDLYVVWDSSGHQVIHRLHDDGRVWGGIITGSTACMDIDITPAYYYLGGTAYLTAQTTLTIAASHATLNRYDLIVVDSFGVVSAIQGSPAANPLIPQHDPGYQVPLTSVYIPAAATCLPISTGMIYNENIEWTTGSAGTITVDYNNTDNPHALTKAAFVSSYNNAASLTFTDSAPDTAQAGEILKFWISLNIPFTSTLSIQFYRGTTAVSTRQVVGSQQGFFATNTGTYMNVSMPVSSFQFSSPIYDKIVFYPSGQDLSGAGGFYLDEVQIQRGITPQGKTYVDSVSIVSGSDYYWKNGIATLIGVRGAGGGSGGISEVIAGYGLTNINDSTLRADSTLLLTKLGAAAIYQPILTAGTNITIVGNTINSSAGGGSQNLNQVSAIDSVERHTILAINNYADTTAYLDSIVHKINFSSNTATNGIKGKLLWTAQSEKYNTNDPAGRKYGRWFNWLTSNNYNGVGARRGEILYYPAYNMNNAGGTDLAGEASFANVIEADYGRKFEAYHQIGLTNGFIYRPWMFVYNKDTILNDMRFSSQYFHITPIDTAANYVNFQNGVYTFGHVPGHNTTVSNPVIELKDVARTIAMTNNSSALNFSGGLSYGFDAPLYPQVNGTLDLGSNSNKWKGLYANSIAGNLVVVPDANYTQLITDHTLVFKNITANRQLTLSGVLTNGQELEIITGQNTYKVTLAGNPVRNTDGTTLTEVTAGLSMLVRFDVSTGYWQVVSRSAAAAGTSGTVTSIATQAPVTGGTITSTGTIGVDTTTALTGLATKSYVLTNGALPSQSGNSGKFLTTNGTVASWGAAGLDTTYFVGLNNVQTITGVKTFTALTITGNTTQNQQSLNLFSSGGQRIGVGVGSGGFMDFYDGANDFRFGYIVDGSTFVPTVKLTQAGKLGLGSVTSPTAYLHLPAGTASAATAPLKFTAGTQLTTPESGVLETITGNQLKYSSSTTANSRGFVELGRITSTATGLTADATHNTIVLTATGQTITLPTAVGIQGRIYTIKLTASGTGTVATTSSQTIDASTTYSLSAQYKYVTVQSDNANWIIIADN